LKYKYGFKICGFSAYSAQFCGKEITLIISRRIAQNTQKNRRKKNDADHKSRHRSTKIGIENYLLFFSLETVSFLRPLLRRADKILRPLAVAIRARKPCLFFLLRVEGWNVLFILFSIYSKNRTAKVRFISNAPNN